MIIACPACATRYVVPDSAIGVEGRTVRCAKCRHSWFQEGSSLTPPTEEPGTSAASPPPAPPPPPAAPPPEPVREHTPEKAPERTRRLIRDDDEPPLAEEPVAPPPPAPEPPFDENIHSQFDHEPPFRPRRNWLRLWTWAAIIFALFAGGTIVAVSYFGLPDWVPVSRPTFAAGQQDLQLDFPPDQQERRQLPNGTEYFGVSGTVTNIGSEAHGVPPILIVLRDERDRIVFSFEIDPPKSTLAPGETVRINEAVTDVPRAAKFADIGWKPS